MPQQTKATLTFYKYCDDAVLYYKAKAKSQGYQLAENSELESSLLISLIIKCTKIFPLF